MILVGDNEGLAMSALRKGSLRCRLSTALLVEAMAGLTEQGTVVTESWLVRSKDNADADRLSRVGHGANDLVAKAAELASRGIDPDIDLMADNENKRAPKFVGRFRQETAYAVEFFSL